MLFRIMINKLQKMPFWYAYQFQFMNQISLNNINVVTCPPYQYLWVKFQDQASDWYQRTYSLP